MDSKYTGKKNDGTQQKVYSKTEKDKTEK